MQHSEEIKDLVGALAKAQGEIEAPVKDATVTGSYTFKYATLDGILSAIRKPFSENGLWFIQTIDGEAMVTRILHSSGQWIDCESQLIMPSDKKPQSYGSALTYSKRYGLCMALGIAAEDDDDGNMAAGHEVKVQTGGRRAAPRQAEDTPAYKTYSRKTYKSIKNAQGLGEVYEILADGGVEDADADPWVLKADSNLAQVNKQDPEIFATIVNLVKTKHDELQPTVEDQTQGTES